MTLTVTIFKSPRGQRAVIEVQHIYPDDEAWFKQHGVKVSMEEAGGTFVIYGDIGRFEADGRTPSEVLVLSKGRNCEDTLAELRVECEKALKEQS